MDRGAWKATVHGVAKNRTRLSDFTSLQQELVEPVSIFVKLTVFLIVLQKSKMKIRMLYFVVQQFYSEISYIVGGVMYLLLNGRQSVFTGGNLESLQGPLQAVLPLCSLISFLTSLPFAHSAPAALACATPGAYQAILTPYRLCPDCSFLQSALLLDIALTKSLTTFKFQLSVSFLMRPTLFGLLAYFASFFSAVLNSSAFYLALLFVCFFFPPHSTQHSLTWHIVYLLCLLFIFSLPARPGV